MNPRIVPIVEGFGETDAVPMLLRRVGRAVDPSMHLEILSPTRKPKGSVLKAGGLETEVEAAFRRVQERGAVLVVIDSDELCPRDLAPWLLERAVGTRGDLPLSVVMAHREYEAWFLEAAASLRGHRGLPTDLRRPEDSAGRSLAEEIRGAKGWLSRQMGRTYRETEDQPALTSRFNLMLARRSRSFEKCYREIVTLLRTLTLPPEPSDIDEPALSCARRFDAARYRRESGFDPWPAVEHFLLTGSWDVTLPDRWAIFASLESGLCRWPLVEEPRHNGLWRAFRSLFLEIAPSEAPSAYVIADADGEWRSAYLPDLVFHLDLAREHHEQMGYDQGG